MSIRTAMVVGEPCNRIYVHRSHLITFIGGSNQVIEIVCPGWPDAGQGGGS